MNYHGISWPCHMHISPSPSSLDSHSSQPFFTDDVCRISCRRKCNGSMTIGRRTRRVRKGSTRRGIRNNGGSLRVHEGRGHCELHKGHGSCNSRYVSIESCHISIHSFSHTTHPIHSSLDDASCCRTRHTEADQCTAAPRHSPWWWSMQQQQAG